MSIAAHELLKSDLMRMAELLVTMQHSIPPVSVIAKNSVGRPGSDPAQAMIQQAEKEITETLEVAQTVYERVRAATDPRVELVKCIGVFRDDGGTAIAHAVALCTGDELDQGAHYDMVRAWAESEGYDVATGDPVVDEHDGEFSSFSNFEWSEISPRAWLVSDQVKSIFIIP